MGYRVSANLKNSPYQVSHVEVSEAGRNRLRELGISRTCVSVRPASRRKYVGRREQSCGTRQDRNLRPRLVEGVRARRQTASFSCDPRNISIGRQPGTCYNILRISGAAIGDTVYDTAF